MPKEDHYDSYSFNYFALAILSFILIFWTWRYLKIWHKAFFGKYVGLCKCVHCRSKAKKLQIESRKPSLWGVVKFILFIALWALAIYLVRATGEGTAQEQAPIFDPYQILGLDYGATEADIKKAYRVMSLKYHPDKNKEPGANDRFIQIAKAHETLTDPAIREKWEKYGNPDGPQAIKVGIALPTWLIERNNSMVVLGVYVACLVIIFPSVVIWYWNSQKNLHTNQISKNTMYFFYQMLRDSMRYKKILKIISVAPELVSGIKIRRSDEAGLAKLKPLLPTSEERKVNRNKKKVVPPHMTKNSMLLESHFSRLTGHLDDQLKQDLDLLVKMTHPLLMGVIEISASRRWWIPIMESIWICQMATQAVWNESTRMGRDTQLLQLPHFTEKLINKCSNKKWKIYTVLDLIQMDKEKRREMLKEDLTDEQINDIEAICGQLPHDIDFDASTGVDEDDVNYGITAGSIVTMTTIFQRPSRPKSNPNSKEEDLIEVHAPFFPLLKNEVWWLIIVDERTNMLYGLKRITSLVDGAEAKIPFQAPKKPGLYSYTVHLMSDSYVGFDKKKTVKLNVTKEVDYAREVEKTKAPLDDPELEDFYSDEDDEPISKEKDKESGSEEDD